MERLTNEQFCEDYSLMDDVFFQACFSAETEKLAACIVDPIFEQLGYEPVEIEKATIQTTLPALGGRGLRLDLVAKTKDGTPINIEIQQVADSSIHRRSNFHHSMLQAAFAEKNVPFAKIPDTVVIFIVGNDIFKRGLPAYVTRTCFEDNGEPVSDGRKTIFVCSDYRGENPIGYLMGDIQAIDWEKVKDPILRERIKYLKNTIEGRKYLMTTTERIRAIGREEGIEIGRVEGIELGKAEGRDAERLNMAMSLLSDGLTIEFVVRHSNLPKEKVIELQGQLGRTQPST